MSRIQCSRRKHLGINAGFLATVLATGKVVAQEDFMMNLESLKSSLVRISGDRLIGIGFLGEQEGKAYIFTNASVISGHNKLLFENLEGKSVLPKSIELSATRDLVRFGVEDNNALKLNPEIIADEVIAVLDYKTEKMINHGGIITGSSTEMIEINAVFEQDSSGSPLLDGRFDVRGVANHLVYYKANGSQWAGTPRRFAYKLDDAHWYAARWKTYNKTYGKNLREIDEFRDAVYSIAKKWIDRPKTEIEIAEPVDFDFDRWVKEHNGMVSDLTKAHSKGSREGANEKLKKRFQRSCAILSKICADKAEFLEFLCRDKKITKYLHLQFKWRSLELKKFGTFVMQHAKRHERDRWM